MRSLWEMEKVTGSSSFLLNPVRMRKGEPEKQTGKEKEKCVVTLGLNYKKVSRDTE